MAVPVETTREFRSGTPVLVVPSRTAVTGAGAASFDVTQDGRRFLIRERADQPDPAAPMHVILNWPTLVVRNQAAP